MIAHLAGTVLEKHVQRVVIDVGGVGYDVAVPLSTFYGVGEPGSRVALRVHTHVREDAIQLFGFASALELQVFEKLIGVSGIGPKVALAVLSGIEVPGLVRAIRSGDFARLTRIPGVGRKTAERIVIELRDRLPQDVSAAEAVEADVTGDVRDDLLSALANLGYQRASVEKIVDKTLRAEPGLPFEAALRAVLRAVVGVTS